MTTCFRNWMKSGPVNIIFAALDNNARFVGGAVRDALLGRDASDIDINTPILPKEVSARLQKKGIKVVPTGIKHGTVTAVTNTGNFEITTLRRDIECYGRHAEVMFTDAWEEDAARRDFTINAMSCSQEGEVFDYFGGVQDLTGGRIKFVGNAESRCHEDYLRILRFFRFFAYYGKLPADWGALNACAGTARGIEQLSGERISAEMIKILASPGPIPSLQLMIQTGVLNFVVPGIQGDRLKNLERLASLNVDYNPNPLLKLAALLQFDLETALHITKRWKLSNIEKNRLLFLCNPAHRITPGTAEKGIKKLINAWGGKNFADICMLEYSYGMDRSYFDKIFPLRLWQVPEFPVRGADILLLDIKPGKEIGAALLAAGNWWEENNYMPDKKAILEFIRKL